MVSASVIARGLESLAQVTIIMIIGINGVDNMVQGWTIGLCGA